MSEERLMKLLLSPHVSEKSTRIADKNRQFVFKVVPYQPVFIWFAGNDTGRLIDTYRQAVALLAAGL